MPTTSPDNIYSQTTTSPHDAANESQMQASSIQAALNNRERFTYIWANDTERLNQTGMAEGSQAYQLDTKTEYQYENAGWRLATPHIEFTASMSNTPNGAVSRVGTFTMDNTNTTSALVATATGPGVVTLTDPGLYAISSITALNAASTGRSFLDLSTTSDDAGIIQRNSIVVGEDKGSLAMPNLRSTAPGLTLYFKVFQTTGTTRTVDTTIRITRIG